MRIKKFFSFLFILLFILPVPRVSSTGFYKCRMILRFFFCCSRGGAKDVDSSIINNKIMSYENSRNYVSGSDFESERDSGLGSAPGSSISEEREGQEVNIFFKEKIDQKNSPPVRVSNGIFQDDSESNSEDEDEKIIFYKEGASSKNKTARGISPSAIMEWNYFIHSAYRSKKDFQLPTIQNIRNKNKLVLRRLRNKPLRIINEEAEKETPEVPSLQ